MLKHRNAEIWRFVQTKRENKRWIRHTDCFKVVIYIKYWIVYWAPAPCSPFSGYFCDISDQQMILQGLFQSCFLIPLTMYSVKPNQTKTQTNQRNQFGTDSDSVNPVIGVGYVCTAIHTDGRQTSHSKHVLAHQLDLRGTLYIFQLAVLWSNPPDLIMTSVGERLIITCFDQMWLVRDTSTPEAGLLHWDCDAASHLTRHGDLSEAKCHSNQCQKLIYF